MAIYTGDMNRVTGLSGMDTESMIDKMMKAESAKYERMQKEEITLTWRQEAYRQMIKSMQAFQDKWFSTNPANNIGLTSSWNNFVTSVKDSAGKDSSAITIKNATAEGKYEIEVTQVAQTESMTGKDVLKNELSTDATVDKIVQNVKDLDELNFKFEVDGVTKDIQITATDLASAAGKDDNEKLKNLFNEKFEKAFGPGKVTVDINSDDKLVFNGKAGSEVTIKEGKPITKNTSTTHGDILKSDVEGKYTLNLEFGGETYTIEANFTKDDDADKRISKLTEAFKTAKKADGSTVDISKKVSLKLEKDGDNLKITNLSGLDDYEISGSFSATSGSVTNSTFGPTTIRNSSNLDKLGFKQSQVSTKITENTTLSQALGEEFTKLFDKSQQPPNGMLNPEGLLEFKLGEKTITISQHDTIGGLIRKVNDAAAGFELSFNSLTGRFKVESTQSGENGAVNIADTKAQDFFKVLGVDVTNKSNNDNYVQGQDSKFIIDGIEVKKPTNDINMDGLQFTINGVSSGKITIESKQDVDATFKKIKEFVDDYNKLITDLEKTVNEKREKSGKYGYYEPLLDEQKKAMSEDEVKKWEEHAKKGLLHNDEILGGILSDFRGMIYDNIDIGGGKTISLYEIGITTGSDYNSGKLTIDEEKLKKAIAERGEDITKMFTTPKTGIADKMKKVVDDAIGTKGSLRKKAGIENTSSVHSNDISKEMKELAKRMKAEQERLYTKEMKYFDMFARMEMAMNKQNSQMSMLLGMTGQ